MKPIIFNTEMVRAILDGRKTQTRRPVKNPHLMLLEAEFTPEYVASKGNYPPYRIGDVLYVRETYRQEYEHETNVAFVRYKTGETQEFYGEERSLWSKTYDVRERWKPSIHMPKWAARILLKVKAVRVERVKDISEADAIAEGVEIHAPFFWNGPTIWCNYNLKADDAPFLYKAKDSFLSLYQSIYGNVEENPWVWVIEFERIDKPEGQP